jgi:hypothetical protein
MATLAAAAGDCLRAVHVAGALPWAPTVLLAALALRAAATLPLAVHQQRVLARLERLRPALVEWRAALEARHAAHARRAGTGPAEAARALAADLADVRKALLREHRCHPWRAALPGLLHVPLWVLFSLGLRDVCAAGELAGETCLWLRDLAAPDPSGALPALLGGCSLLTVEVRPWRVVAVWLADRVSILTVCRRARGTRVGARRESRRRPGAVGAAARADARVPHARRALRPARPADACGPGALLDGVQRHGPRAGAGSAVPARAPRTAHPAGHVRVAQARP